MRSTAPPRAAGDIGVHSGLSRLSRKSLQDTRIPRYAIAVIQALRFSEASSELLESLDDAEWTKLLHFCDPARLTLTLGQYCRTSLPDWVRARIDQNYRDNAERFAKLESALLEVADHFTAENIEFVLLKGSAHSREFTPNPLLRTIGDIDILVASDEPEPVMEAFAGLSYVERVMARGETKTSIRTTKGLQVDLRVVPPRRLLRNRFAHRCRPALQPLG